MGMRTYRGLLIAVLVVTPWIAKYNAQGASIPTCNGKPATYVGTAGADSIEMDDSNAVAVGAKGNDAFRAPTDDEYWSYPSKDMTACGWAGNDSFYGTFRFIDGGGGFDIATVAACSGLVVKNVEVVKLISCEGPSR